MEIHLTPERKAQLDDYARRHGQDPAAALDDAFAAYLDWERQDYQEAVEGIRQGYEDLKAGRTQPADEVFEELAPSMAFRVKPTTKAKRDLDIILGWLFVQYAGESGLLVSGIKKKW